MNSTSGERAARARESSVLRAEERARARTGKVSRLRLEEGSVTFRDGGAGEPVILVAGLGLTGRFYSASYEAFAQAGLRLIVPDLPGFGKTPSLPGASDIAGMARFLGSFARALGIRRAAWVGHSVGAQLCVELAAADPEIVSRAALVGPTGARARLRRLGDALGLAREAARMQWRVIGGVAADYVQTSPMRYVRLWLQSSRQPLLDRAAAVACPVLVVVGTEDPVVPDDGVAALLSCLRDARLTRVPGAGHGLPRESPDDFHSAVLPFLTTKAHSHGTRQGSPPAHGKIAWTLAVPAAGVLLGA